MYPFDSFQITFLLNISNLSQFSLVLLYHFTGSWLLSSFRNVGFRTFSFFSLINSLRSLSRLWRSLPERVLPYFDPGETSDVLHSVPVNHGIGDRSHGIGERSEREIREGQLNDPVCVSLRPPVFSDNSVTYFHAETLASRSIFCHLFSRPFRPLPVVSTYLNLGGFECPIYIRYRSSFVNLSSQFSLRNKRCLVKPWKGNLF